MAKEQFFPKSLQLDTLNNIGRGCMVEYLGIEFTEIGNDYLIATMPVDERTKQPLGLLHGGASVVLAETMGSIGANICLDLEKQYAVGLAINANHIRSVKDGKVTGKATPIHIGKSTHVWSIEITDAQGRLAAISRITMAILNKKD